MRIVHLKLVIYGVKCIFFVGDRSIIWLFKVNKGRLLGTK